MYGGPVWQGNLFKDRGNQTWTHCSSSGSGRNAQTSNLIQFSAGEDKLAHKVSCSIRHQSHRLSHRGQLQTIHTRRSRRPISPASKLAICYCAECKRRARRVKVRRFRRWRRRRTWTRTKGADKVVYRG